MSTTVRPFFITLFLAVCAILLPLPGQVYSQEGLPPGTRLATEADLPIMRAAGIPNPIVGMAWDPNSMHVGESVGKVKMHLLSLPRTGSAAVDANIESLDPSFATCSSIFLKEFQRNYGPVTITSAYRSPADEARLCVNNPQCGANMNNPNPNSLHSKGYAMDVKASVQKNMIDFAQTNPQFGVCFPFTGETEGFKDDVHMILAGIASSETKGPGCAGVTKVCDAGLFTDGVLGVANMTLSPTINWLQQTLAYQPPYPMVYRQTPTSMLPPPLPMPSSTSMIPTTAANSGTQVPTNTQGTVSAGASTSSVNNSIPTNSTQPIYATSSVNLPSASLIIAQSNTVRRNGRTLISWTSVGMIPASCSITKNGDPFGTAPQGSKILSPESTVNAGTIQFIFTCKSFSGIDNPRIVNIVVE